MKFFIGITILIFGLLFILNLEQDTQAFELSNKVKEQQTQINELTEKLEELTNDYRTYVYANLKTTPEQSKKDR